MKSEGVCHVYGHRGDGIYQSLSCSARIICYATSQSFEKEKRGWGAVKGEQTINVRSVSLSFTLCSRDPLLKILIINYWCVSPALSGGGHRRGEGGWDFPMWPHPALLQPPRWDLLRHHHQPGRGVQSQGARTSAWYFHSIYFHSIYFQFDILSVYFPSLIPKQENLMIQ